MPYDQNIILELRKKFWRSDFLNITYNDVVLPNGVNAEKLALLTNNSRLFISAHKTIMDNENL